MPGWSPGDSQYPLRLYLEKLLLWYMTTTVEDEVVGPLIAGRLHGRSPKKFVSGKTSSLAATTWSNLWAVHYFKKIYLRILYVFKPFQDIGRDNDWTNACLVHKMNVEFQNKRRQGSQRTSNGSALQYVAQVIEAKLMLTCKVPTPVV